MWLKKKEPLREPKKTVLDRFGREREVRISRLCQYCPNGKCLGYYQKNARGACATFINWRNKTITLHDAVADKHKQNKRHQKTDPIRDKIYEIITEHLENSYRLNYEDRTYAGNATAAIIHGEPVEDVMRYYLLYVPYRRDLVQKIKGYLESVKI